LGFGRGRKIAIENKFWQKRKYLIYAWAYYPRLVPPLLSSGAFNAKGDDGGG
jgi:hypothetical protein